MYGMISNSTEHTRHCTCRQVRREREEIVAIYTQSHKYKWGGGYSYTKPCDYQVPLALVYSTLWGWAENIRYLVW